MLSVIIITWNRREKLRQCLSSIAALEDGVECEVIVVDNNSRDGTFSMLEDFPEVRRITNKANQGVATARNQGIKMAKGDYLMMLDDDTCVRPGCFDRIVTFMDGHPDCWCAGTKTVRNDGELEFSARTFYTLPIILFRRTFLGRLFPNNRFTRAHLMADWDHNTSRRVDWVAGASFVMRKSAVDRLGPFDEGYFFGFEDMDWCFRVAKGGGAVYYIHDAIIEHNARRSSKQLISAKAFAHFVSTLRFFYRNRPSRPAGPGSVTR